MNNAPTTTKSVFPKISAPTLPKKEPSIDLPPYTSAAKFDRFFKAKCFHLVYRGGTRFRAGKIIELVDQSWALVAYYSLKTGELQPQRHLVRLFGETTSVATLDGFWIHEDRSALEAAYRTFLSTHLQRQAQDASNPANSSGGPAPAEI